MDYGVTEDDEAFRREVAAWLAANVPDQRMPPAGPAQAAYMRAWQRRQFDAGWAGITWPEAYGGRGLSLVQQLIWYEEYARAGAPDAACLFVGLNHGGPTLIARGSEEQKAFHLPKILNGESIWCQGFSEPGAGSDLASLRTRGRVEGDTLVVNGQKIWTSNAEVADYQELLVRTDPDAQRHRGLTWIICDMKTPGITVRPIESMDGEHHNCEVFYDDVCIPLSNVVGNLNEGWRVALSTLSFERGTALIEYQLKLSQKLERLIALAREHDGRGDVPIEDGAVAARLGELRGKLAALSAMIRMSVSRAVREDVPGPESTYVSLLYCELSQEITRVGMDILGVDGLERPAVLDPEHWVHLYLRAYSATIGGGTSEIRRNIIGERVLGLPRHH